MAEIKNSKDDGNPDLVDGSTGTQHDVPSGAAHEDSPGGYGGDDRLQSEAAPLHPDAGKDQAKDI